MKGLSTKSLSLAYDGALIIRDLNLAIPAGQISGFVGANGCGKSTLLRGLARLLKPRGARNSSRSFWVGVSDYS